MVYSNIECGGDKPYNNLRISNSTARAPELRCFIYGFLLRCWLWVLVALFFMGSCCPVFYGFLLRCFLWVLVALFFNGFLLRCFLWVLVGLFLWVLVALFFMGSCCAVVMGSCCAVFYGFLLRCFLWVLAVQLLVFSVVFSRSLLIFISFLFFCPTSN